MTISAILVKLTHIKHAKEWQLAYKCHFKLRLSKQLIKATSRLSTQTVFMCTNYPS